MHSFGTIAAFAACLGLATAYPPLLETRQAACNTPSGSGTCQSTSSCAGISVAGFCSGGTDNQCCVTRSCSTSSGSGTCKNTSKGCSGGTFVSGACPGDSSVQCCVASGGGGNCPSDPNVRALDISSTKSSSFYTCAKQCYDKMIVRGYRQACGSGGGVDPNFGPAVSAARSAGFTDISAYLFPCTGTQPTGVACKSPSQQLSEFEAAVAQNGIGTETLWFDIEPTSGECNAWNLGASGNTALARQWITLLRNSRYTWGVYANGNQWSGMFGTRAADVASDLPLWAVDADGTTGVGTVNVFMGGWTQAYGKQYRLDTTVCGGQVDQNSFIG